MNDTPHIVEMDELATNLDLYGLIEIKHIVASTYNGQKRRVNALINIFTNTVTYEVFIGAKKSNIGTMKEALAIYNTYEDENDA